MSPQGTHYTSRGTLIKQANPWGGDEIQQSTTQGYGVAVCGVSSIRWRGDLALKGRGDSRAACIHAVGC